MHVCSTCDVISVCLLYNILGQKDQEIELPYLSKRDWKEEKHHEL